MPVVTVEDPGDARLQPYLRLTDMQLRTVSEPAGGIFIAEGEKVIRRALAAGLGMLSGFMERKWWSALQPHVPAEVPVYLADPQVLREVTGYRVHRGALAAFRRPPARDAATVLAGARTALLLEDLVDHTNVGAIFRSAAALGVDAVLVTRQGADPWYRRSLKTSMGAVFSVPWATVDDAGHAATAARTHDMRLVALDPSGGFSLRDWQPRARSLLLLGTEGAGLSKAALTLADQRVRIPMSHGVDSLNVAMAATLACYVLTS